MLVLFMHMQRKKKNKKSNYEEGGDRQKNQDSIEKEKQDPFQFVSAWLWSSWCFIIPYIFK